MINLNQLRAFHQAAKHLSFTLAAKELCITQPAVTSQVRLLEDSLGLRLFRKKGGKLDLTEEGRVVFHSAKKLFECEREIETAVQDLRGLNRGTLRLGTARTYARHFMPELISRFHENHPRIEIQLEEGSSLEMIRALTDMKSDLAVVARAEEPLGVCFVPLRQEELVLILPRGHRLAQMKSVPMATLLSEPFIMKERGSGTRRLVDELFERNRCMPKVVMESSDAEMIKLLVQHGEGISFLAGAAVASEIQDGKLMTRPIDGEKMLLDVSVAYLRDQPLSPPARAFLDGLAGKESDS